MKSLQLFWIVTRKFCRKSCFMIFNRSKITFNRSSALFDRSNRNQIAIETSRNSKSFFFTIFDRSIQSFDRSKILIFKFSLRKFQNLKFHFMKPYSPNSNIISKTYPCIYLYIQHFTHKVQHSIVLHYFSPSFIALPSKHP